MGKLRKTILEEEWNRARRAMALQTLNPELSDRPCECAACALHRRAGRTASLHASAALNPHGEGCECGWCRPSAMAPAKVPEAATQTIEQIFRRVTRGIICRNSYMPSCPCLFCSRVRNDPMFPGEPDGAFAPVPVPAASSFLIGTIKFDEYGGFVVPDANAKEVLGIVPDGLKHLSAVSDRIIEASQRKRTNRNLRGVFT